MYFYGYKAYLIFFGRLICTFVDLETAGENRHSSKFQT